MEMVLDTKTPVCLFVKCWIREKMYNTHRVAPNGKGL